MSALREHVEGLCGEGCVALRGEEGDIAGEGRGVAGDVDHLGCAALCDVLDDGGDETLARRIDDDEIELAFLFEDLRKTFRTVCAEEFCIFDAVNFCVVPCVFDRRRNDLDAVDLFAFLRGIERDGACAAVEVCADGICIVLKERERMGIVLLGLIMVDLKECIQGNIKGKPEERLADAAVSVDGCGFCA